MKNSTMTNFCCVQPCRERSRPVDQASRSSFVGKAIMNAISLYMRTDNTTLYIYIDDL